MKQKTHTTRKVLPAFLLAVLAVCVALGIMFAVPVKASADTGVVDNDLSGTTVNSRAVSDNRLTDGEGNDYKIENHVYGDNVTITAPELLYGNEGETADPITYALSLDGVEIGDTFGDSDFNKYLNSAMPAGNYTLNVTVGEVSGHNGFTQEVTFTVEKGTMNYADFDALNAAIYGKEFTYIKDGNSHLYEASLTAVEEIVKLTQTKAGVSRVDTIWAEESYDGYFGNYEIKYNLLRMYSDEYLTQSQIETSSTGLYTVFYCITAPNYYSTIEKLPSGFTRQDYKFYVVNVQEVEIPTSESISHKVYDGQKQTADIPYSDFYKVKENYGGINAGTYPVVLELREPQYYMWLGQKLDDRTDTIEVEFVIDKAENSWSVAVNVIGWEYKKYDIDTNLIMGTVAGGTVKYAIYTDSSESPVEGLDAIELTEKTAVDGSKYFVVSDEVGEILNDLSAGTYRIKATVTSDDNHKAIADQAITFKVTKTGHIWVDAPSIMSWVKGEYNEEENVVLFEDIFGNTATSDNLDILIYSSEVDEADIADNLIYHSINGEVLVNTLSDAKVGHYTLKVVIKESRDYYGAEKTFNFQIFAPEGLAWWVWLIITVVILAVIGVVFFILHQKGVLQMITGKSVVSMRAKMTVDATVAAVRANKVAENAKKTIAAAEAVEQQENTENKTPTDGTPTEE